MRKLHIVVLVFLFGFSYTIRGQENPFSTMRTWTDTSGKFSIQAEFVASSAGFVILKRDDGKTVRVAVQRLSKADQQYIEEKEEVEKKTLAQDLLKKSTQRLESLTENASSLGKAIDTVFDDKDRTTVQREQFLINTIAEHLSRVSIDGDLFARVTDVQSGNHNRLNVSIDILLCPLERESKWMNVPALPRFANLKKGDILKLRLGRGRSPYSRGGAWSGNTSLTFTLPLRFDAKVDSLIEQINQHAPTGVHLGRWSIKYPVVKLEPLNEKLSAKLAEAEAESSEKD